MSKSLAELLASAPSRPSRVLPDVCLDQDLTGQVQRLNLERAALEAEFEAAQEEFEKRGEAGSRKAGEKAPKPSARIAEIDAELEVLNSRMAETGGELLLRATTAAEWQRFKDENPPREGNRSDRVVAYGFADAGALLESLPRYVVEWNGEPIPQDQRQKFCELMSYPDQVAAAALVLEMFEVRVGAPKVKTSPATVGAGAA